MTGEIQAYALAYARRGIPVIPLYGVIDGRCECGRPDCAEKRTQGKHPILSDWGTRASVDEAQIKEWFPKGSTHNIGVPTDHIVVVDTDPRNGGDKSWRKIVSQNHDVHTWRAITGRGDGGQHLYFQQPDPPLKSCALAQGIELQSTGKLVVGVGSLHIMGKRYGWLPQCSPREAPLLPAPAWLGEIVSERKAPKSPDYWQRIVEGVPEHGNDIVAGRNEAAPQLIGNLFRAGLSHTQILEFMTWWDAKNRPPLGREVIETAVDNIYALEKRRLQNYAKRKR